MPLSRSLACPLSSEEHLAPAAVRAAAKIWDVPARRTLVVQAGVPADVWYGVRSGLVALVHDAGSPTQQQAALVDVLEPGQWFGGDVALAAETVLPSSLYVVRRADMQHIAEREPAVQAWLHAAATARTQRVAERLSVLTQAAPEQRVRWAIALLLQRLGHASQGMRALGATLPQAVLARVAGTSRQTVNRTMMALRRDGALRLQQGRIVCPQPDAVQTGAGFPFSTTT